MKTLLLSVQLLIAAVLALAGLSGCALPGPNAVADWTDGKSGGRKVSTEQMAQIASLMQSQGRVEAATELYARVERRSAGIEPQRDLERIEIRPDLRREAIIASVSDAETSTLALSDSNYEVEPALQASEPADVLTAEISDDEPQHQQHRIELPVVSVNGPATDEPAFDDVAAAAATEVAQQRKRPRIGAMPIAVACSVGRIERHGDYPRGGCQMLQRRGVQNDPLSGTGNPVEPTPRGQTALFAAGAATGR